jgi:hypothetical protein
MPQVIASRRLIGAAVVGRQDPLRWRPDHLDNLWNLRFQTLIGLILGEVVGG